MSPRRQGTRDTEENVVNSENQEAVGAPVAGISSNVSGNSGGRGEELGD